MKLSPEQNNSPDHHYINKSHINKNAQSAILQPIKSVKNISRILSSEKCNRDHSYYIDEAKQPVFLNSPQKPIDTKEHALSQGLPGGSFMDNITQNLCKLVKNHDDQEKRLKKRRLRKREDMRRLRCKVLSLVENVIKPFCGHNYYQEDRFKICRNRLDTKIVKHREISANLISQSRKSFEIPLKVDQPIRPIMLDDESEVFIKKNNIVERLCALLTKDEINEISDDPIFYFSDNNGYVQDPQLTNVQLWNKEAGLQSDQNYSSQSSKILRKYGDDSVHSMNPKSYHYPTPQSMYYHDVNNYYAKEFKENLIYDKCMNYTLKNALEREKFEERWAGVCEERQQQHKRYVNKIKKNDKRTEAVLAKIKESVEYAKDVKREEEMRRMENVYANRAKLQEIKQTEAMDQEIKTACKALVGKKLQEN